MLRPTILVFFLITAGVLNAQHAQQSGSPFEPISSEDQFLGVWILEDSHEYIYPLCLPEEEFCDMSPGGNKLIFSDNSNYFFSYVSPESGAAINLQFTYERTGGHFDCILTMTNAAGYWMEHEYQSFSFELEYSEELNKLQITSQDLEMFHFRPATEKDLR
ncbi:hypothetical protein N9Y60_03080 [Crocinitomicaceae bacterium]|nr:hypothetical protein [Crocinitomicaceae bacterium]